MNFLEKVFNWMLVIGVLLLIGRVVTAILLFMDIPFISFFKDYSLISVIILIIGAIGSQIMKDKKK
jgi:hypothetical protein